MNGANEWFEPWLLSHFLAYCRIQAFLITLPFFSERVILLRIRISLAISLTPLFASFGGDVIANSPIHVASYALIEVVVGLVIGSLVRVLSLALEVASSAIAMAASLSQIVGVPNEYSPHPIGNIFHISGAALLMTLGYPLFVCDLLRESFALKPIGGWPRIDTLVPAVVALIGQSFILALVLAAPFILGGLLYQALSGVISKVMPALPIVFIGAPAAILLALFGLALLAPAVLSVWSDIVISFTLPEDL